MDITYKTINGVRYAFAAYRNETFQTMAETTSEEEIQDMFLKVKGETNRHTDIGITGGGHHDHGF